MTTAVVIVGAGSGQRLGSALPKAFVPLAGKALLQHCVEELEKWDSSISLIVVVPDGWSEPARALTAGFPGDITIVAGGVTRTASVRRGVAALPKETSRVLIHDAARALVSREVFQRVTEALKEGSPAVIPCLPIVDTLVTRDEESGATGGGVDRDALAFVQTPQGFDAKLLIRAYGDVSGDFSDDAEVMRVAGHRVDSVAGESRGFKITYPDDLKRAEALLREHQTPRVGFAMDVHGFDDQSPLNLAGLLWPGEKGLAGHSDGDVVIHAIVDALLQAASLGDLGTHFGSDREEFLGASSTVFLQHALGLLTDAGFQVASVGVQIVGNTPKVGPRRLEAQEKLSSLVGAPVSVSATTSDGLGLTGRGEGIAAMATAVLTRL